MVPDFGSDRIDNPSELQICRLLKRPDQATAARLAEVAHRIHGWQTEVTAEAQVMRFLQITNFIESIKTKEASSQSFLANTLAITLARVYAARLPADNDCIAKLANLERALHQGASVQWLGARVSVLFRAYTRRLFAVGLLRKQMPTDDEARRLLGALGIDPKQAIASLVAGLNEYRQYGVKPCLFADGQLHDDADAWAFTDGYDFVSELPASVDWARPLAVTALGPRVEMTQLKPVLEQFSAGKRIDFDFTNKLTVVIQASGEFTVDVEVGAVSLRDYFAEGDRTEAYDLFRIVHLLRLYSLIVPHHVSADLEVPEWPTLPAKHKERKQYRQRLLDGLRPLLLPRLRVLENPAAIRAALETELCEAEQDTEARTDYTKKVKHEVIGFVRKLATGQSATDTARQLAWEQRRIILKPGETYTKTHNRGTRPNLATGHIAVVK